MSAPLQQQHAKLTAIVGAEHVHPHEEHLHVAPADTQQIAAVLQYADARGLTVTPVGGRTKNGWGNPVPQQLTLEMHRMNTVHEHAWQDMTCTVQAGCTWAAMQTALARHNQHVALDPLWPGNATVGGIIAANDSGALRLKYGGLRDLIIGMTIVLADGTIAKSGGKVVKNVAGYDLHKLMTGAFGTLGVIAEVNFRLHPMEKTLQTWSITASDAFSLDKPLRALLDSQLAPISAQVRCGPKSASLDVRLASSPERKSSQHLALEQIADGHDVTLAEESIWSERERLASHNGSGPEQSGRGTDHAVLKVSLPHDEICNFLARVQLIPSDVSAHAVAQAHGLLLLRIEGSADSLVQTVTTLCAEVSALGGSVFIQTASAALRESIDVWGEPPAAIALMHEIKRQFDPNRTLNPGRFVGGI
ncbi:MAG TPA: FAD-binding oxidoreductase [Acidobacteriaceae bacterium]|jgi:glycolate oxidase FAD binding subunit|nr:FAD-binding oxidoreductase [Acidobacteriaceae bacterium]